MPIAALTGIPWTYLTSDVTFLYKTCMWGAWTGPSWRASASTPLASKKSTARAYIFMSNHISNLDPPITLPLIPRRSSVMVKKELSRCRFSAGIMRLGSLVPVDRGNRDAGISAVRDAVEALRAESAHDDLRRRARSFDGKLLPFKKGPFYLAKSAKCRSCPSPFQARNM